LALIVGCSSGGDDAKGTDQTADPADEGDAGAGGGGDGTGGSSDTPGGGDEPSGALSPTALVDGCSGQKLREGIPDDLAADGPWPVGAVTTTLGGVNTEVWYPAKQGSQAGQARVIYDMREHLPPTEAQKIPEERNPRQDCDCYRDLPLDDEAGPYPVILFIHGTAGFRTTNLDNATHWASRGFVVIAGDHPGIMLRDMLGGGFGGGNQTQDGRAMLSDLAKTEGDLAFLAGHLDMQRVAAIGHSAGGGAVSGYSDIADVIVVYAAGGGVAGGRASSMMSLMGASDSVARASSGGYDGSSTASRRYVSIAKGGHLVGGNLCTLRDPTNPEVDIVDLANEFQLGNALLRPFFGTLFDGCNATPDDPSGEFIPASRGIEIMNYVTSGVFEETLHCAVRSASLSETSAVYGADIADYMETLP
jgi:hypothetical protein